MSDAPERRPYRLGAGEGRRLWAFGDLMILKATTDETNGRLFVMEQHVPRHRHAPGRHVHAVDDQAWFVIAGQGRFFVGDETLVAGPGDFIHGPHGIPHAFSADSPT
jgi:quercetin dioxygenase-like cupin family protein